MKIQIEAEIFDDSKYCEDEGFEKQCKFLHEYEAGANECGIFYKGTQRIDIEIDITTEQFLKCDQCKEALKKAKEPGIQSKYNTLIRAVARKYKGETRFETALKYINQEEMPQEGPVKESQQ